MHSYASLTQLKELLSPTGTPGDFGTTHDTTLRRILEDSSMRIDRYCERHFYLWSGTKYYDGADVTLLLPDDVQSITTLKVDSDSDGVFDRIYDLTATIPDAYLYPYNKLPKNQLSVNIFGAGEYSDLGGKGRQKAIEIIGVFGYGNDYPEAAYYASGAMVAAGNLTDSATTHALATGSGAYLAIGQTILIDSEQLYITGIATDTITFRRAQNGTTAAAHTAAAIISIYEYPAAIVQACLIQTLRSWTRKNTAFQNMTINPELGGVSVYKSVDPEVAMILADYRNRRFA